jgi:hypothetical protein
VEQPTVGTDLRAVIPVASDDLGGGVRLISIEIYDKGVALRLLATPGPDPPRRLGDPPPDSYLDSVALGQTFALSDDAGTRYRYLSGGAWGHADAARIEALYVPAPPDGVRSLVVSYHDQRVSVRLP